MDRRSILNVTRIALAVAWSAVSLPMSGFGAMTSTTLIPDQIEVTFHNGSVSDDVISHVTPVLRTILRDCGGTPREFHRAHFRDLQFPQIAESVAVLAVRIDSVTIVIDDVTVCPSGPCRAVLPDIWLLLAESDCGLIAFYRTGSGGEDSTIGTSRRRLRDGLEGQTTISQESIPTTPDLEALLDSVWRSIVPLAPRVTLVGRYARVATRFPAREIDGVETPLRAPGPGWIVSGFGAEAFRWRDSKFSQVHTIVDGVSLKGFLSSFPLP
jgi:hypothetical protein